MPNDQEMIAVKLDALAQALNLAGCCVRTPNLTETAIPFNSHPFWFSGEIFQFDNEYNQSIVVRVPAGQTGVINYFSIAEHFPGTMAGVKFSLLVNGMPVPSFPRVQGLVGLGTGNPQNTWIPLPGSAEVSVVIDCAWLPDSFTDHVQFGVPFTIGGYYMDGEYFVPALDNSAAPQGIVMGDNRNFKEILIPGIETASSVEDIS